MADQDEQTIVPHLYAPVSRKKRKERFPDAVAYELKKLGEMFETELKKAESWSCDEWKKKAGLYVDMKAVYESVCLKDIFGIKDEEGKVKESLQEEFGLAARLAKRLIREGARQVLLSVTASSDIGMAWQARSEEPSELAQILEIGY